MAGTADISAAQPLDPMTQSLADLIGHSPDAAITMLSKLARSAPPVAWRRPLCREASTEG